MKQGANRAIPTPDTAGTCVASAPVVSSCLIVSVLMTPLHGRLNHTRWNSRKIGGVSPSFFSS